jgi:hypothetical protein
MSSGLPWRISIMRLHWRKSFAYIHFGEMQRSTGGFYESVPIIVSHDFLISLAGNLYKLAFTISKPGKVRLTRIYRPGQSLPVPEAFVR